MNFGAIRDSADIVNNSAAATWTAAKNPKNQQANQMAGVIVFGDSVLRKSLPIVVKEASEETGCQIRSLSADNKNGQVTLKLSANPKCENETVLFFACTQDSRGVQSCSTNLGQAKIQNSQALLIVPLPASLREVTKLFFRATYKLQSVDSSVSDTSNLTFAPIGSISLNLDSFKFKIDNPLAGKAENVIDLLAIIANFVFQLGVPVAVIVIIYSGILFLVSRDKPAIVLKATNGLKYAAIGLAILLIGKGFVSLIQSILSV